MSAPGDRNEIADQLYLSFRLMRASAANCEEKAEMPSKVTVEDVQRVAELAHLELTTEESQRMVKDLSAILDYVDELNELDTSSVAPLAQVSELEAAVGTGSLRKDVRIASLDRHAVMPQAPETDQVFFKVPKVIER